jgi:uncharacterized protein
MESDFISISSDQPFQFSCGSHISCFNECCRDLNQFLTPYDIVRLKNSKGISSKDFLERYTTQHTGPESGLPIIRLREKPDDALKCPFVTEEGCSVYHDRPSSCRAYPIARAVTRNRRTGHLNEHFMLIKEPHCKGFQSGNRQSAREWIENQGLPLYNQMNDLMMELISLKNKTMPGPLDLKSRHFFHMACYDIDSFREKIFTKGFIDYSEHDKNLFLTAKEDDTALLKISLAWIQKIIFGNPPLVQNQL